MRFNVLFENIIVACLCAFFTINKYARKGSTPSTTIQASGREAQRKATLDNKNCNLVTSADLYLSFDGKNFVQAQAKIEDNDLVEWSDEIGEACEIRYCYSAYYGCQNIFNSAALPASPFRFVK